MEPTIGRAKLPKNYQLVYEILCSQAEGHHAAASEIYAAAKHVQPSIGYSTVYRALDRLRDLGLVLELRLPGNASALYEPARSGHAHFHCLMCGRVEDVEYNVPAADLDVVASRHKVQITNVITTLNGVCALCRAAES